jgi:hypothetical protein
MQLAIFGIENDGLNLAVNLFLLMLVVVYFASIAYTFMDARRRIQDPVLVACATVAAMIPFMGVLVYMIVRPPEFLEDAHERELEITAAELRVRQLAELSCPNCGFPVEKNYLRCPSCQRRLKDPCHSCGKPVDPRWALCPYCETALPGRAQARPERRSDARARRKPEPRAQSPEARAAPRRATRSEGDGGDARRSAPPAPRERPRAARQAAPRKPAGEGGPGPAKR